MANVFLLVMMSNIEVFLHVSAPPVVGLTLAILLLAPSGAQPGSGCYRPTIGDHEQNKELHKHWEAAYSWRQC